MIASQCWVAGRVETSVAYSEAGQMVIGSSPDEVPYGMQCWVAGAYLAFGQPERWIELCHAQLARGGDTHAVVARASLVVALTVVGSPDEAMATATGLIEAAEATRNPYMLSFALLAYGYAVREADPIRALDALHRSLMIARDTGNRFNESTMAPSLARLETEYGDPLAALDYLALLIHNFHDSGNTTLMGVPMASLATFMDRLGHHESAATIVGFALSPLTTATLPELEVTIAHLRSVLSDQTYESLARMGETMNTAAMVTYAYDQIDQARTELNAVSIKGAACAPSDTTVEM